MDNETLRELHSFLHSLLERRMTLNSYERDMVVSATVNAFDGELDNVLSGGYDPALGNPVQDGPAA